MENTVGMPVEVGCYSYCYTEERELQWDRQVADIYKAPGWWGWFVNPQQVFCVHHACKGA